jgi:hypothetical protein
MLRCLARASRTTDIGNRALAFYLHEMHERREYQSLGFATAVHLATSRLRIPRTTARELIATGGELVVLKRIDRALCEGEITWSTAKVLCRVAVPETEEEWLALGKRLSCRELAREIAGVEKGRRPRGNRRGLPAQVFDVHTRIDNVQHEMFETARRRLADTIEEPVDNRLLVMTLVEAFLRDGLAIGGEKTGGSGETGRRSRYRSHGLLYHLVVQQCPGCRETLLHTGDGPVELPSEKGDAIACEAIIHRTGDAPVDATEQLGTPTNGTRLSSRARTVHERQPPVTAHGETGRAAPSSSGSAPPLTADTVDIPTPAWMRTQVLLRDGVRCVCCGGRRNLQAHHVRHRYAEKGVTHPINLATLCETCHEGCHNGNLGMEGDADRGWVFTDREGRRLDEPARDPTGIRMVIGDGARSRVTPIKGRTASALPITTKGDVVSLGVTGGERSSIGSPHVEGEEALGLPRHGVPRAEVRDGGVVGALDEDDGVDAAPVEDLGHSLLQTRATHGVDEAVDRPRGEDREVPAGGGGDARGGGERIDLGGQRHQRLVLKAMGTLSIPGREVQVGNGGEDEKSQDVRRAPGENPAQKEEQDLGRHRHREEKQREREARPVSEVGTKNEEGRNEEEPLGAAPETGRQEGQEQHRGPHRRPARALPPRRERGADRGADLDRPLRDAAQHGPEGMPR